MKPIGLEPFMMRTKFRKRAGVNCIVSFIFIWGAAEYGKAQGLLPTEKFQNLLSTCAAGLTISIDANLIGSITSIYAGDKTTGKARLSNIGAFLRELPEKDRLKGYEVYVACIQKLFPKPASVEDASLTILNWPQGGWEVLLTNPTAHALNITDARLTGINPSRGQINYGFTLEPVFPLKPVVRPGEAIRDSNIQAEGATKLFLRLYGSPQTCGNWRAIREKLFTPGDSFPQWQCKIEVQLVSISGERGTVSDGFVCNRIPVPPPRC
jgi:hypothetical protein